MANEVENYPGTRTKAPRGVDLVDITISDGVGGFDSEKMSSTLFQNVLAEHIGLDCNVVQEVSMTLVVDTGVRMFPKYITCHNTAAGKDAGIIVLKIGSSTTNDEIMPPTQLAGFFDGAVWIMDLEGVLPELLSASSTYFLQVITPSSGVNIVDVRVHGNQFDV